MKHRCTAVFILTLLVSPYLRAENPETEETFDIDTVSCWDLGAAAPEDRVSALMLVYGYVAAQRNRPTHSGDAIQSTLEQTGKLCSSNPDMYVSEAMERAMK